MADIAVSEVRKDWCYEGKKGGERTWVTLLCLKSGRTGVMKERRVEKGRG